MLSTALPSLLAAGRTSLIISRAGFRSYRKVAHLGIGNGRSQKANHRGWRGGPFWLEGGCGGREERLKRIIGLSDR
jgi:hypothetical protein